MQELLMVAIWFAGSRQNDELLCPVQLILILSCSGKRLEKNVWISKGINEAVVQ
jgi:hypothetical protein